MPYKINGTDLTLQPSVGKWIDREELDVDGNGMPVYTRYRSFEISWELVDMASFEQVQTFFDSLVVTGSVVATLPKYKSSTYLFESYTGCVMHEPTFDNYWMGYAQNAKLLLSRIRT